ncbi:MAG TPA: C69 family dipeptidase [Thermoguttaceae bacterium]|nr:C69 family dipeptidase [Thermoguttaceae bacterium]
MRKTTIVALPLCLGLLSVHAAEEVRACTSIMVGKKASADGSVMTSHTCDSHRTGSQIVVVPGMKHKPGARRLLTKRRDDDSGPMPRYGRQPTGDIPQVAETLGYLAPGYAVMNQRQLAVGESTFGGREELQSDKGAIDCETLTRLMLERAATAREAIRIGGRLLEQYGWCDEGEALTIADPQEVWLMEIVGPGKDAVGAIWVARRVPDDHVSVVANAARIGEIDLSKPDFFMASRDVFKLAEARGYWNPESGPPSFWRAYDPEGRMSVAATRREWRVFDLLAPSLRLHPNANEFPFSVKPEKPVGPEKIMELFRDTFEGTDFDMVKDLTVTDEEGKTVKSPLANPFMPYDMNRLLKINGGWGWRGERPMARWYCMYVTVTQSRSWLPDSVGGVVWFGYGNPAMTTYVPLYAGIKDLPPDYKTDGRTTGFSRRSAWWAYNRVATLAAQRWGEMRVDVASVRDPLQEKFLAAQEEIAKTAGELLAEDPAKARAYLTRTTHDACFEATQAYWNLGDLLWTKYDEKW